jgi:hypothetical protein
MRWSVAVRTAQGRATAALAKRLKLTPGRAAVDELQFA